MQNDLHLISITLDDPRYQTERELRNVVLLRPVGVPDYGWEMRDKESHHIVALEAGAVVGCVLLWPAGGGRGQLMQMAVAPEHQGKGIGRILVRAVLNKAVETNLQTVFCHARAEVIPFYAKLGFTGVGERFEEVGLEHLLMECKLAARDLNA